MKAMKIGLLNKGNLTNYLLWLGRCENPYECFWIPERNAGPGGLLVCLSGEGSWVPAQGLRGADFTAQNTPASVYPGSWRMVMFMNLQNVSFGGKLHHHLV